MSESAERKTGTALAEARGSAKEMQVCSICEHWGSEPRNGGEGYCTLFNKHTLPGHGMQCTAWCRKQYTVSRVDEKDMMKTYQERVVAEKRELDERGDKLDQFILSEEFGTLPAEEQERLRWQLQIMGEYSEVLGERIAAFSHHKAGCDAGSIVDTVTAQRFKIQELGEQLTDYQTMLFCLCVAKGNEGGLRVDLRNKSAAHGSVLRFRQDEGNPNVTVVTVEPNK